MCMAQVRGSRRTAGSRWAQLREVRAAEVRILAGPRDLVVVLDRLLERRAAAADLLAQLLDGVGAVELPLVDEALQVWP